MLASIISILPGAFFASVSMAATVIFWRIIERKIPAECNQATTDILLDYKLVALRMIANWATVLLINPMLFQMVNAAGGGLFRFRADGLWIVPSVILWLLIYDFLQYWLHRLSHVLPPLWAIHSLHHSAQTMTASTGARHCWLGEFTSLLMFAPIGGLLFVVPTPILKIVGIIQLVVVSFSHANIRASAGLVICGPQYHRIHHSRIPEYVNRNFAELLPIWDVIFGTLVRPKPGEYPPTGLSDEDPPRCLVDGVI